VNLRYLRSVQMFKIHITHKTSAFGLHLHFYPNQLTNEERNKLLAVVQRRATVAKKKKF